MSMVLSVRNYQGCRVKTGAGSGLIIAVNLFPSFLTEAFTGGGAPVYAGRGHFTVDEVTAFIAFHLHLVGEYFNLITTTGAFI
jgi:hypothetical protein